MYVCVCNAVTEDDVRGCMADGGCRTAKEVKAACGMKPGCGSCTKRLYGLVSEYRTASELVEALVGPPILPHAAPEPAVAPGPLAPGPLAPGPLAPGPVDPAGDPFATPPTDPAAVPAAVETALAGAPPVPVATPEPVRVMAPVRSRWLAEPITGAPDRPREGGSASQTAA
ncbi:(2Fe-2S)-binding protein [Actinomadura hibisca]|uniref:(2Fe-2S)-binding protein n=1 Tax=Actinomadura hibisca TaxID=68565 RepID=UPI000829668C|nr:(2Fe-2S)-binding protein [Actinomadura hibisca]